MNRRDFHFAWLWATLANWLKPSLPPVFGGEGIEGANAALTYRKMFAWAEGLLSEDVDWLRESATIAIDNPRAVAMVQAASSALEAMREAASIRQCRWENEVLSPDDLDKEPLKPASLLSVIRVTCLSARRHTRMGQGLEALNELFAGLTLAHRVGTGGVLIARILEGGSEGHLFRTLGRLLPRWDHATLDDLSRRLEVLAPPEPASATIGPESRFILGSIRGKLRTTRPRIDDEEWTNIGFGKEETEALKRLTGGDRDKLLAHLETTGPAFAELARRLDLPRPGYRAALDEFAKSEQSTQPIVAALVANASGNIHVVDRMIALRSLIKAALVLLRQGQPAFRKHLDPFGKGPFGLTRRGQVDLIRSALSDESRQEVSLEIGGPI
ncbi:hypothetical protein V5E97_21110 [Singulisphaera sp. Ch08]|uniref:Uncharacterized protein n=1 Tax=Singulisphaera sp. Ch08 TaxID=3120278 RepID=A0AAU7C7V8_9BACT